MDLGVALPTSAPFASPDPVSFEGRYFRIPASIVNPKPRQEGGIPIIMGSLTPAGIERAARFADGLNPIAFTLDQKWVVHQAGGSLASMASARTRAPGTSSRTRPARPKVASRVPPR
jgi:alkanesulfonate monooxygenase SsuD/methylene tetrahydromethanopterin reductase-like flavin-dependent oxidoreductase (luciferase family)